MKILYDYQAFCIQKYGGVSNCFVQLISHLPEEAKFKISIKESENMHLKDSNLVNIDPMRQPCDHFLYPKKFTGQRTLYDLYGKLFPQKTSEGRNQQIAIEDLKHGHFEIFHPTFFNDYFLPYLNGIPFVLTIHDMIPELYYPKYDFQVLKKKKLVEKANHIITVSEKTKEDLMRLFNVSESKITVIYHGAPKDAESIITTEPIKGKYILYVGVRKGYKNFIPMIQAILPVLERHRDINIVCTGPDFSLQEKRVFQEYNISDRIIHVRPSDNEMMNIYKNALCFIFPSLYEGFGIPILEAFKASCPVLLNHASCFPEIAQNAAIYFHLNNQESDLPEVMESFLLLNNSERQHLIQRQKERLLAFSWEKSAQKLYNVYENVIIESKHSIKL